MRIGFITSKIDLERAGGSVPDLDCKVRMMQKRGAEAFVVTVFPETNKYPQLPYEVLETNIPKRNWFSIQRGIVGVLRKHESSVDVFHVEGQFAHGAALYRLLGGKPVVLFYNREIVAMERRTGLRHTVRAVIESFLYRYLVPYVDHIVITTPQLLEAYKRFGLRVPLSKVLLQPDYVDPSRLHAERTAHSEGTLSMLASGRMIPEKGFALLLDALAQLPRELKSKVRLTLSGDGPERSALTQQSHGCGVVVVFPGWIAKDKLFSAIASADALVYPRFVHELSSVLVLEAMTLNTPVIVPAGGGLEWLAGEAAATFENENAVSLSRCIADLIRHPGRLQQMSQAAEKRMREFDPERMSEALYAVLAKAAKLA